MMNCIRVVSLGLFLISFCGAQRKDSPSGLVKKCLCGDNTVPGLDGTCVPHEHAFVHIWLPELGVGQDVPIQSLGEVVVEPLVCPANYHLVSESGLALLSVQGNLLPSPEPETSQYCLEYYLNDAGRLQQRYEYCTFLEEIHLCCPFNQTLSASGQCIRQSPDHAPLQLWPEQFDYVTQNVECERQQTLERVHISNDVLSIKKIYGRDSLGGNETCLVAHEHAGNVSYYRRSCDCDRVTCISYCCPQMMAFDMRTSSCISGNYTYDPPNFQWSPTELKRKGMDMTCDEWIILDFSDGHTHQIEGDGSLQSGNGEHLSLQSFCLGVVQWDDRTFSSGLACAPQRVRGGCEWRFTVIRIFLVISSVFIALTLVVYLSVPNLRNRIGGACLISELVALLISQVVLVIIQTTQHHFSPTGCLVTGVIELVFLLASFFWLNVMCFDVWSTFRVLRPFNEKLLNLKLFAKYCLYAWGIPMLIGGIVVWVEVAEIEPRPTFLINDGCFFVSSAKDLAAQWIYLYGIILVLLCVNCCFFAHVGAKLLPLQMEQRKLFKHGSDSGTSSNSNVDLDNFKLYCKLFVIMGLPWLLEVFTSFALDAHECYIWILDIFNLLRGLLIFVIFVCKRTTREKIAASWFPLSNDNKESTSSRKTSVMSLSTWLPARKISTARKMDPVEEESKVSEP